MSRERTETTIVQGRRSTQPMQVATIAISASESDVIDVTLYGARNFVFVITGGWTAADLGFSVSYDGVLFSPLYNEFGTRVLASGIGTITAPATRAITVPETYALGNGLKIILHSLDTSTGAALNQGGERKIQIVPLY